MRRCIGRGYHGQVSQLSAGVQVGHPEGHLTLPQEEGGAHETLQAQAPPHSMGSLQEPVPRQLMLQLPTPLLPHLMF